MKQTAGERIAEEWGRGVLPGTVAEAIDAALVTQKEKLIPQWQPIATAPQDGFHLLLYRADICFVGYYAAGGDWVINAPGLPLMDPPPTHWMLLPKAPNPSRDRVHNNQGGEE